METPRLMGGGPRAEGRVPVGTLMRGGGPPGGEEEARDRTWGPREGAWWITESWSSEWVGEGEGCGEGRVRVGQDTSL